MTHLLRNLVIGLCASLAPLAAVAGAAASDESIRIMPLGDSITQGGGREHAVSYRYQLWKLLVDTGVAFDLVGSQAGGPDGPLSDTPEYRGRSFDPDHEGHWGCYTDQLLREGTLERRLAANIPDVVLLHLGTNDAFREASAEETRIKLTRIIEQIRAVNPDVTVLLARLINSASPKNELISAYNAAMPAIAAETADARSAVIVVDLNTGFDPGTMTVDGTHPNAKGAQWMAARWFDALRPVLGSTDAH